MTLLWTKSQKLTKRANKTSLALERHNSLTARQFKQYTDKLTSIDKTVNDKLQKTENNVNTLLKSIKDSLNRTISSFTMQIKDVLADNRLNTEKVKQIITECEETKELLTKTKFDLIKQINDKNYETGNRLAKRIDRIVEDNLYVPGVIEDPEGDKNNDGECDKRTLKDYVIKLEQGNELFNEKMTVRL